MTDPGARGLPGTVRDVSPTARVLLRPAAATLAAGLVVLTVGWGTAAGGAPQQVEIVDFAFQPTAVSLAVGETVTWRWTGESRHSVTAPGRFDSHPDCTALTPGACGTTGDTFTWTADAPGTISYRCRLYPDQMQGVVEVTAAPPSPSPEPPPASPSPDPGPEPTPQPEPTPEPTPAPPPSPRPSPSPSPSSSPSRAPIGPPTSPPAQPVPTVTPSASPTPRPSAPSEDPDLEPFPEPVVPSASASPDPLADDVVAVQRPATDPAERLRVVAGVTFGVTLLTFARVVLFGRGWF